MVTPNLPKGPVSAVEFMRALDADPDHRAKKETFDAELAERSRRLSEAARPLLADLSAIGCDVESLWTLRTLQPYPDGTIQVLLQHLGTPLPDRVREGIARALAVVEARPAWPELVQAYRNEASAEDTGTREGLAEALMVTASRATADELVEIIQDRRLGPSRILLLRALTRLRLPDRWGLIAQCRQDPDLVVEADHMLAERARRTRNKT